MQFECTGGTPAGSTRACRAVECRQDKPISSGQRRRKMIAEAAEPASGGLLGSAAADVCILPTMRRRIVGVVLNRPPQFASERGRLRHRQLKFSGETHRINAVGKLEEALHIAGQGQAWRKVSPA